MLAALMLAMPPNYLAGNGASCAASASSSSTASIRLDTAMDMWLSPTHCRQTTAAGRASRCSIMRAAASLATAGCCSSTLETTGLAGGAGTYAFLVGCAWYQDGSLRVRQFFLSNFTAERVLLETVAEIADSCGAVVTYNGKSFDLPLIETRFLLHRLETPFAGVPHVDMLHPARRLWREDGAECRLNALEQLLCGHRREGDVPGFEIPSRYFHFVRTGDARRLEAVMEHNRLDLISLAMLTARASQLLEDGPAAARTGREAVGHGTALRAGRHGRRGARSISARG
jgi:hypothetical protein